ncbi:hypothetical protein NEOKW01_2095 [Nematocida sp. AWRm80]|nr:hypothetical protein NEOKW01_2095 [Nematocida sp. AWRm80]
MLQCRAAIERLLQAKEYPEIFRLLEDENTEEAQVYINIYRILLRDRTPEEKEALEVIERHPESYIPAFCYAEYLVRETHIKDSLKYYKQALSLCTESLEQENICRKIVLVLVFSKEVVEAYYYAYDLVRLSTVRYNVLLLYMVCRLADTMNTNMTKDQKEEITDTYRKIEPIVIKPEIETETIKEKEIEIRANKGFKQFLKDNQIELSLEKVRETGRPTEYIPHNNDVLDRSQYQEYFNRYIKTIEITEENQNKAPITLSLQQMIQNEDIMTLSYIADRMYKKNRFSLSRYIYKMIIRTMEQIDSTRYKFLHMCMNIESYTLLEIAMMSVDNYELFKDAIKKYNLSVFLSQKEKNVPEPLLENQLQIDFPEIQVTELYRMQWPSGKK